MPRFDSIVFFFTGKKSENMKRIESNYPKLGMFHRDKSFFHAFGNFNIYDGIKGWIVLLPAYRKLECRNTKTSFFLNCGLFSCYFMKKILTNKIDVKK